MNVLNRFISDQRGAVVVIFGLLLPGLLGIAALAIEVGHWYSEKEKLQIAADSAAYSALVAYSLDKDVSKAVAVGKAQARASGFTGMDSQIAIAIPAPGGTLGANSSRAVLEASTSLYLSSIFLNAGFIDIGAGSYAAMEEAVENSPCMLALDAGTSRAIAVAASVQVSMNCVVATNSSAKDAIWAEGTATLASSCARAPGTIGTNGGARIILNDCSLGSYPRETTTDALSGAPFWGSATIPDTSYFVDQSISQGRYGVGMPGGNVLQPGKYGKQVEIDGTVTLQPGIYYFTNGFRAAPGSKITGKGVTIMVDQGKVLDIAQNVAWDLTAPASGPTQGMAIMGHPSRTGGTVRLIGILGNVQGAVHFPNQTVQTESGPNLAKARCTQLVARTIDIRGGGRIDNDCSAGTSGGSGSPGLVRLVRGPA